MNIVLIVLLAAAVGGCGLLWNRLVSCQKAGRDRDKDIRAQREKYEAELKACKSTGASLQSEVQRLSKWQVVADADAKASELMNLAKDAITNANSEAANLKADAQRQVVALLTAAKAQATKVLGDAQKSAQETAGEALEAKNNMAFYEKAVKALKNQIEGYGDEYIIPAHSLLDDLAAEYGHAEAGEQLKAARDHTRAMVRAGTAATCEYVEEARRKTAIEFVVDAFNGKADSSLSRIKQDNYGVLSQEIKDAFTTVNLNGKAFRDARIREEYLVSRLEELKWAVVAMELKAEEKEEQRRIKEQIREEEKSRREYERALKETAKEEELLRRAMDKARQQIDQSTAEQKAKYEQQLIELAEKLRLAEEKNQRALSMAQQTKRGHVYIISNIGSFGEHVYKVGLTRRLEPLDRIRELGDSSVPFEFDVHALIFSEDAPALENKLHKHFVLNQLNKVNHRKEFFRVDLPTVKSEIEALGLEAKWTMTSEAREYRETQAIEAAIRQDPIKRAAWIDRQLELDPVAVVVEEIAEDAVTA